MVFTFLLLLLLASGLLYLFAFGMLVCVGYSVMGAIRGEQTDERAERVRVQQQAYRIHLRSMRHRPMKRLRPRYRIEAG